MSGAFLFLWVLTLGTLFPAGLLLVLIGKHIALQPRVALAISGYVGAILITALLTTLAVTP